jgi:hypothetical protein
MRFGVREIANVVFKAKTAVRIGNTTFAAGQPVLYIDTAKTSTLEGSATTVYATGGRGNTRLVTWEGEKTLTFTVEDALLSPIGLAVLTGAGLIKGKANEGKLVHVHTTTYAQASATTGEIDLSDALGDNETICKTAPLFVLGTDADGSLTGEMFTIKEGDTITDSSITIADAKGKTVFVDYYVTKNAAAVSEIQIDAANFAGYYYVEADTLFRRQAGGVDLPANITIPNVKIQSNFTFSMASTGDPSTFTFTMDAMPGYTYFDKTKKVLCVIQVVEDAEGTATDWTTVMGHTDDEKLDIDDDGNADVTSEANVPATGLTVTSVAGNDKYGTLITVAEEVTSGNEFVYKLGTRPDTVNVGTVVIDGDALTEAEIAAGSYYNYVTVYEIDADKKVVKAGSARLVKNLTA